LIESLLALVPAILLITDSHGVGAFGREVEDALRRIPNAQVDTYAMGGATPDSFFDGFQSTCTYVGHTDNHTPPGPRYCGHAPTPKIEEVLHGQVAVIALGTNLLWNVDHPGGWDYAQRSLERMARYAHEHASACFWIGPPDLRIVSSANQAKLYALLAKLPCGLVDSREFTHYPAQGGDGCHYGGDAAMDDLGARWGKGVGARLVDMIRTGAQ
jgi:hypothetical protein